LRPRRPSRGDRAADVRAVDRGVHICVALVRNRTSGSRRAPRAAALGWKLETGMVSAAEVAALCAAVRRELACAEAPLRWVVPSALRVLLAEYRMVRATFDRGAMARGERLPRARRPADRA
jgi:hypothetical protein